MERIKSLKTDLWYNKETTQEIIDIIDRLFINRTRVILDYGDTKTGKSWGESFDIKGRIGRSTGTEKIPLLVFNARSMGGGGLLSHCIVKITESKGGKVLYRHPNYQPFKQETKPYFVYNYDTQNVEGDFDNEIEAENFATTFLNAEVKTR